MHIQNSHINQASVGEDGIKGPVIAAYDLHISFSRAAEN